MSREEYEEGKNEEGDGESEYENGENEDEDEDESEKMSLDILQIVLYNVPISMCDCCVLCQVCRRAKLMVENEKIKIKNKIKIHLSNAIMKLKQIKKGNYLQQKNMQMKKWKDINNIKSNWNKLLEMINNLNFYDINFSKGNKYSASECYQFYIFMSLFFPSESESDNVYLVDDIKIKIKSYGHTTITKFSNKDTVNKLNEKNEEDIITQIDKNNEYDNVFDRQHMIEQHIDMNPGYNEKKSIERQVITAYMAMTILKSN